MRVLFALLFLSCLARPIWGQEARLQLPRVSAEVELDGTLGEEEWREAQTVEMDDGVRLLLQQDGQHLFLAVDAQAGFSIDDIFIRRGGQIWNLHASAAIGTIAFASSGDGWTVDNQSGWSARGTDKEQIDGELKASLETYGWAGTNAMLGNSGQREFALRLEAFLPSGEREFRLVVTHLHLDPERVSSWPQTADSCIDPAVLKGYFPEHMAFQESGWGTLVLGGR